MYISKDAIVNVPINKKLEAELIKYFMDEHYFVDDDESQEVRSLCFEVREGYGISNKVISNINKIILKYNLE